MLKNMESLQEARIKEDKDHRDEFFIREFDIIESYLSSEDLTQEEMERIYDTYLILIKHVPSGRGHDVVIKMMETSNLLEEREERINMDSV